MIIIISFIILSTLLCLLLRLCFITDFELLLLIQSVTWRFNIIPTFLKNEYTNI